ncbi:UvrB/UvrC motif-containing protein [Candidatus Dojkabacteria bacterium]|uniref:UvrABC system protein B n=1 Tax=Candidatus Dojkabacteria bacterium TaxID=2099670 RepID=A0A955RLP0_9BACT|nr:UvrB/UvrC motif-containing protein [Candidatus Dojkabacteria bacterium]
MVILAYRDISCYNYNMANTELPKDYEGIVYQIIRPTGLLDPVVEVRPSLPETFENLKTYMQKYGYTDMPAYSAASWEEPQIPDLLKEIKGNIKNGERVLVTTLTKRMAEELSDYLIEKNIKSKYLHSDIDTVERVEILRDLRKGLYDVIVGINLLREGLDLPEVSLVAIIDADKEGFLRSDTSLIQTIGRAARHVNGRVIMYCDKITESMQRAIDETRRRRKVQEKYNHEHGITPTSIKKAIKDQLERLSIEEEEDDITSAKDIQSIMKQAEGFKALSKNDKRKFLKELEFRMSVYADMMEFEKAAEVRDLIEDLKN